MQKKVVSLEMVAKNRGVSVSELFKKIDPGNTIVFSEITGTLLSERWRNDLDPVQAETLKNFLTKDGRLVLITTAPVTIQQYDLVQNKFLAPLNYNGPSPIYIISLFNLSIFKYHFGELKQLTVPAYIKNQRPERLAVKDGISLYYALGHISIPKRDNLIILGRSPEIFSGRHAAYAFRYEFYVGEENLDTLNSSEQTDIFKLYGTGLNGAKDVLKALNTYTNIRAVS